MVSRIEDIVDDLARGKVVVLVDDEARENEGDLVFAAEKVTPGLVNFMVTHARGLVCVTLTREDSARLGLTPMANGNSSPYGTKFTVSVEAATGVTTGISAQDRARTIGVLADPASGPSDLVMPGHVFPIMAEPGGVLVRAGHTEAGCDLCRMAGLAPSAVICEIMREDGEMARMPDLERFSDEHGLRLGTIESLIHYRARTESLVTKVDEFGVDRPVDGFVAHVFEDGIDNRIHVALVRGRVGKDSPCLVRVMADPSVFDFLGDGLGWRSWSYDESVRRIEEEGCGILLLLDCGGTLARRLLAGRKREGDASPASSRGGEHISVRTYGIGAQILHALGARKIRILSGQLRLPAFSGFDLDVVEIIEPESGAPGQPSVG